MVLKAFVAVIVTVGVLVGVLALVLPRDQFVHLIGFRDFLDVSLPILAFGALIKYLCSCTRGNSKCCEKSCSSDQGKCSN